MTPGAHPLLNSERVEGVVPCVGECDPNALRSGVQRAVRLGRTLRPHVELPPGFADIREPFRFRDDVADVDGA